MTGDNNEKSDLDKLVENIQNDLDADARATFSKKVLAECNHPQNIGRMKDPDAIGIITGPCGDTMEFFLKVMGDKISSVQFMTDGCAPTIACGSMLSKIVKDKTFNEISRISNQDLIKALDGLPDDNKHCAKLAVDTLQKAVENFKNDKGK